MWELCIDHWRLGNQHHDENGWDTGRTAYLRSRFISIVADSMHSCHVVNACTLLDTHDTLRFSAVTRLFHTSLVWKSRVSGTTQLFHTSIVWKSCVSEITRLFHTSLVWKSRVIGTTRIYVAQLYERQFRVQESNRFLHYHRRTSLFSTCAILLHMSKPQNVHDLIPSKAWNSHVIRNLWTSLDGTLTFHTMCCHSFYMIIGLFMIIRKRRTSWMLYIVCTTVCSHTGLIEK